MEIVKKTPEYEIIKKRSGRYGVRDAQRKWVNGDEKVKVLLAEKLIKAPEPKKEEPVEAAPEEVVADAPEATAEGESAEATEEPVSEG
ncbi:MAG: hypothetical protein WBG86_08425 [Polyangiales bacterium]